MKFPFSKNITDENSTKEIAKIFSSVICKGDIIALNGMLGSGKTTFVKYVCENFKIYNVSSPSFAIVNEYLGSYKIYHFDFYRIKNMVELYDIGFEDYLNDDSSIIFIEWADLFDDILPKRFYEVNLELLENNQRIINIKRFGYV